MSRVDEALRIAEGGHTGAPAADAAPTVQPSPFNEFQREGAEKSPSEPAPARLRQVETRRPAHAPVAPSTRPTHPAAPVAGRAADSELLARLVTTTANNLSLEQYRRVVAVLHEEQAEGELKTVVITSALPGEGKTLTVVNLALTLSESYGRRVLVIDADLRSPSLHRLLGVENGRGLSEALEDGSSSLPIVELTPTLGVLTAGHPGPTPLAGLSSARMAGIIKDCEALYDWVLIDTPPVGVLPDAQVLVRLVDGVILVIGAGTTPAAAVERAIGELGGPDVVVGTVLNRVEEHRIPDSGYYGYYGRHKR